MPSLKSCLNSTLKKMDLFQTSSLLRYNGEAEYSTVTGGLVSIIVIVIFIILFASMGLQTAQKKIINSIALSTYESNPGAANITMSP